MVRIARLFKYIYLIIIALFFIMLSLFIYDYRDKKNILEENYFNKRAMVERNVLESFKYADTCYKILEKYLNQEMKNYSQIMVEKYQQNPNIYSWDLEKLKAQFKGYDIYIIDQNLEIVHTTFKKDLGLNFSKFPNFAELLRKRMMGDNFCADRLDISTNDFKLKKYSYMPTPDHKYLLELSIDILEAHPSMKDMNIFSHADYLTKNYDVVKKITFYKFNETGSEVGIVTQGRGPYVDTKIPEDVKDIVKKTVLFNEPIEITDISSDGGYTYKYIPYLNYTKNNQLDWWNSYVIGITYDNSILYSKLTNERSLFIGKIAIITLLFILFTLVIRYLFKLTEKISSFDPLTTLPNKKFFRKYFEKSVFRRKSDKMAILFIDLDDFKMINDTYGHKTGDIVLKRVAETLRRTLRKSDIAIRAGGDEFLVLIRSITSLVDAESVVEKITQALNKPFIINGKAIEVKASIGISIYPDNGDTLEELINKADEAMYKEKKTKKTRRY